MFKCNYSQHSNISISTVYTYCVSIFVCNMIKCCSLVKEIHATYQLCGMYYNICKKLKKKMFNCKFCGSNFNNFIVKSQILMYNWCNLNFHKKKKNGWFYLLCNLQR